MANTGKRKYYGGGVVNSVSDYRRRWLQHTTGKPVPEGKDQEEIQKMLVEYHAEGTSEERKKQLKHDILMRVYFMFPSFLQKNYSLTAELFNDAVQNMAANTLRAIELFKPELGYSFSNYLVGYFKDAAVKALKTMYMVPNGALRQAAIDADLPEDEVNAQEVSPFIANTVNTDETPKNEEDEEIRDTLNLVEGHDIGGMFVGQVIRNNLDNDDIMEDDDWYAMETVRDPHQRVLRGANYVRGSVIELDNAKFYKLAPGTEREVDIDEQVHNRELIEWLEEAMDKESGVLTDEERFILINHFGLHGAKPMIYSDIAKIRKEKGKGCACSRISQITTAAVKKLRAFFEENSVEE